MTPFEYIVIGVIILGIPALYPPNTMHRFAIKLGGAFFWVKTMVFFATSVTYADSYFVYLAIVVIAYLLFSGIMDLIQGIRGK